MFKRYVSLFLLLSLSPLYSQSYEITEEELTTLENIISEQESDITELQKSLTNQKEIEKRLKNELKASEEELKKQDQSLKELEKESFLNKLFNFFIGFISGSLTAFIMIQITT